MNRLEFWYEFASGYSYISACRIEAISRKYNIEIVWKPFLLGPIFKLQGWETSPFIIYKSKGQYMWKDLERQCYKYEVPYKKPSVFPRHSLLATRVALIASDKGCCPEFSKSVFIANYALDNDISDINVVSNIVSDLGRNSEEFINLSHSPDNKLKLRKQVDEAISMGIFGAPTFSVNGELFWGNDRLDDAINYCMKL